jgi:ABC-type nickel/cobalt efflux system permease component RcnA
MLEVTVMVLQSTFYHNHRRGVNSRDDDQLVPLLSTHTHTHSHTHKRTHSYTHTHTHTHTHTYTQAGKAVTNTDAMTVTL